MVTRQITFIKEGHRRTDEDGNVYASVTGNVDTYGEVFDEDYWAKKKAIELGVTPSLIKSNWKQIRDASCEKGNATHGLLEDSINHANRKSSFEFDKTKIINYSGVQYLHTAKPIDLERLANSPLGKKYPLILDLLSRFIAKGYSIYAEVTVYYYEILLAGCTDCIAIKGNRFVIIDWKTNKDELPFTAGYFRKVNGIKTTTWVPQPDKRMYPPINDLPDCKGIRYTLQLSTYARLFELWGYICDGLILVHIRTGYDPKPIKINYLRSHIDRIFKDRLERLKSDRNKNSGQNGTIKFGIS